MWYENGFITKLLNLSFYVDLKLLFWFLVTIWIVIFLILFYINLTNYFEKKLINSYILYTFNKKRIKNYIKFLDNKFKSKKTIYQVDRFIKNLASTLSFTISIVFILIFYNLIWNYLQITISEIRNNMLYFWNYNKISKIDDINKIIQSNTKFSLSKNEINWSWKFLVYYIDNRNQIISKKNKPIYDLTFKNNKFKDYYVLIKEKNIKNVWLSNIINSWFTLSNFSENLNLLINYFTLKNIVKNKNVKNKDIKEKNKKRINYLYSLYKFFNHYKNNVKKIKFYLIDWKKLNNYIEKNKWNWFNFWKKLILNNEIWWFFDLYWINPFYTIYWKTNFNQLSNSTNWIWIYLELFVKILWILITIWFLFFFMKQFNIKIEKWDVQKFMPWEFDLELVDYWWNNNLKEMLEEIQKLEKERKLKEFLNWILLYWPPWTWKTLFWKYLAKELWLPFFYVSSNNLKSSYYWWTWKKIKSLFDDIRKEIELNWYNSWIIFIDELDSIWLNRNSWHEATAEWLNTLLTEIDWFKQNNFIIIWATNRKEVLDDALLSRFNYKTFVNLPSTKEREEIITNLLIYKLTKIV